MVQPEVRVYFIRRVVDGGHNGFGLHQAPWDSVWPNTAREGFDAWSSHNSAALGLLDGRGGDI